MTDRNSTSERPLILVSNDDGITAPGIGFLVQVMKEIGKVVVVAPNSPQSGMGHAITVGNSLRLDKVNVFDGIEAYECSGTPADCIKLAKHYVLKNERPDLVVSGINHGANTSVSVLYSGTMSAAIEAAIEGLPAIGFSLCDFKHNADFSHVLPFVKKIAEEALLSGIPQGVALNVNFPAISDKPLQGVKICRQADAHWQENFDQREDPHGRKYFWLVGDFINEDKGEDTDEWALSQNYASIVPCQFDLTAYHALSELNKWDLD